MCSLWHSHDIETCVGMYMHVRARNCSRHLRTYIPKLQGKEGMRNKMFPRKSKTHISNLLLSFFPSFVCRQIDDDLCTEKNKEYEHTFLRGSLHAKKNKKGWNGVKKMLRLLLTKDHGKLLLLCIDCMYTYERKFVEL